MSKEKWTVEQAEQRAKELTEEKGRTVFPLAFKETEDDDSDLIVGFLENPKRIVKRRAFDKANISQSAAGEELIAACLIKEESDPRITSEKEEHDHIVLGAEVAAMQCVRLALNQIKKN